jgi:transketolase
MQVTLKWLPVTEFSRVLGGIADGYDRAYAFAMMSRINTLYMISRAGSGHIGSSFSAADLVAWLLLAEMDEAGGDVYFSSKGHDVPGLYAAMIGVGRLDPDLVHRLRRIGGLPGHPDVATPHMPFNTGSLGMGISKAKGLVLGNRLRGRRGRVYVMTGDGELQEGQNWEALAGAAHSVMGELTVVVDHNKIQSDTWVRSVSDLGDLPAKFASFGWGVLRCDGHDFRAIEKAFADRAKLTTQPVAIIADTVKGAGCATFAATSMPSDEWRYRYHSGAPSVDDYRTAYGELRRCVDSLLDRHGLDPLRPESVPVDRPDQPAGARLPDLYGHVLVARAARDDRIVALDADLVLDTGLILFAKTYPERFFECGIAEQDMVSMAGGLAARGLLPFVHSFSCFLHSRPNEQIYNNATERRKVVYVGSLAGLVPAGPGHSHQAVRDISALSAVPGLVLVEPAGPAELAEAVDFCQSSPESVYLRLVSAPCSAEVTALPGAPLVLGRGTVIRPGGEVVAIGAGPVVLTQLLRAAVLLAEDGVDLAVVNLPWLNRVDPVWLADLAAGTAHLFVVDNHYARGGQADLIARALIEAPRPPALRFRSVGLDDIPSCGTEDEALAAHGLRADQLAELIRKHLTWPAMADR